MSEKHNNGEFNPHLFHFTHEKSGMSNEYNSKEKIDQIIHNETKTSAYTKSQLKKMEKSQKRINEAIRLKNVLTDKDLFLNKKYVDKKEKELLATLNPTNVFVTVDFDQFFAAVAIRDDPKLKNKPIAIGGLSMISTSNYEARKYGVRSAMPGFVALKLCPQLIFVRSDFAAYKKASNQAKEVFAEYDVNFKSASLDEAYLNITNYLKMKYGDEINLVTANNDKVYGLIKKTVHDMRQKIFNKTKLTCSAGVGISPMIAKIASDINKPNGQAVIKFYDSRDFMMNLDIRKIPFVGKATQHFFEKVFNIKKVKGWYENRYLMNKILYQIYDSTHNANKENDYSRSDFYLKVALACTDTENYSISFDTNGEGLIGRKSISVERTFKSLSDESKILLKLREIVEKLCEDIKKEKLFGYTISLKIKQSDFTVTQRSASLKNLIDGTNVDDIYNLVEPLLKAELIPNKTELRLIGVRLSNLSLNGNSVSSTTTTTTSINNNESKAKQRYLDDFKNIIVNTNNVKDDVKKDLCPICSLHFNFKSNKELNAHVDACLSRKTIREVVKQIDTNTKPKKKRKKIDSYFVKKV